VKLVNSDANRKQYPYSKNRVYLSAIIAALSIILALTLLLFEPVLVLYYFFSTFIVVIITFFLKKRLYTLLITKDQAEIKSDTERSSRKILLITFFMLVGSIGLPLLLAGLLSGPSWFITITSFISGVNISEIFLYIQATSNR
jgi:hypothetical protein